MDIFHTELYAVRDYLTAMSWIDLQGVMYCPTLDHIKKLMKPCCFRIVNHALDDVNVFIGYPVMTIYTPAYISSPVAIVIPAGRDYARAA